MLVIEDSRIRKATWNDIRECVYIITQLIPIGRVVSYKAIAKTLGISPRSVAIALSKNEKPIVIPCHRVVHASGKIGGYTPHGQEFKKRLLSIEGVDVKDHRVPKEYFMDNELVELLL